MYPVPDTLRVPLALLRRLLSGRASKGPSGLAEKYTKAFESSLCNTRRTFTPNEAMILYASDKALLPLGNLKSEIDTTEIRTVPLPLMLFTNSFPLAKFDSLLSDTSFTSSSHTLPVKPLGHVQVKPESTKEQAPEFRQGEELHTFAWLVEMAIADAVAELLITRTLVAKAGVVCGTVAWVVCAATACEVCAATA
jgi:hypothetical protein